MYPVVRACASSAAHMAAQQVMSPDARPSLFWTLLLAVLVAKILALIIWEAIYPLQLDQRIIARWNAVTTPPAVINDVQEAVHSAQCARLGCRNVNCALLQQVERQNAVLLMDTRPNNHQTRRDNRRRQERLNAARTHLENIHEILDRDRQAPQPDRAAVQRLHRQRVIRANQERMRVQRIQNEALLQAARNVARRAAQGGEPAPPPPYVRPTIPVIPLRRERRQIPVRPTEVLVEVETIVHRDNLVPAPQQETPASTQVDQID